MTNGKKSIRSLAEELKEIRERPIPREKIEKFNEVMKRQDYPKREKKAQRDLGRKIAHSPGSKV